MSESPISIELASGASKKANIVLDASKIDLFETCPKRYQIRYILKRTLPLAYKNKSLDLGGLAHEGLEVYFNALRDGLKFDDRMQACLMKINEKASDPDYSNSDPEEVKGLARAVEESCDYWRSDDENCIEVLGVEEPFAYSLFEDDNVRIIISGKIDLRYNYKAIGRGNSYQNLPMDHKTYSRDSNLLRKSNQFINYASACESNYLIVNRIGLYAASSKLRPEEKFKRLPLSYDPIYMADWKENLTKMILNEYITCLATDEWPEKPTSCNKFNRICEYYEICDSSGIEAKVFKLNQVYVDAPEWDVTAKMTS